MIFHSYVAVYQRVAIERGPHFVWKPPWQVSVDLGIAHIHLLEPDEEITDFFGPGFYRLYPYNIPRNHGLEGDFTMIHTVLEPKIMGCVQYWGDEIVETTAYSGVLGMSMRMQRELQFRNKTYPTMLYFLGDGFVQKMRVMYPKMAWLPLSWRENGNIETRNAKTKLKRVQNLLVLSREWGNDPQ